MYDNVCKFLAENFKDDFASWLLGDYVELTELSPTELSLEPIRADSLILQQSQDLVLHAEFQTEPDLNIPFRMIDYRLRVYRRFPDKRMLQVVIYLRKTGSELVQENSFQLEKTRHEFEIIRLWEQPTERFLHNSGLLPFAVLSKTDDSTRTLNQVGQIVEKISEKRIQSNLTAATAILAGLVLKQDVIHKILRRDIMRDSVIYQEILQEGEKIGEKIGEQKGRKEGYLEGKLEVAINLLRGGITIEQVAKFTGFSQELLQNLQTEINGNN
ncbi:MAG: Rpn family recombination-promoting nuclease/putative transposase [Moorea sp. SIO2B7]|nr:Rpn family recombination-promoting nuclease/putative transposase [Moorena sp. SIO2B7]